MAAIKEIAEQEDVRMQSGICNELHLWREGSFLRAYNWSAWLACRYLHEFKLNKRQLKGLDTAVAYIGFPETSLAKWLPEGVTQSAVDEKHLLLKLPDELFADSREVMSKDYASWFESIPMSEKSSQRGEGSQERPAVQSLSLTGIMHRILAFPIESKSPLQSMTFLAEVKQQLADLI